LTVLTTVTLASSNSALPDDGDYTKTCQRCFNVNFYTLLKQFSCASVGEKTLIYAVWFRVLLRALIFYLVLSCVFKHIL